MKYYSARDEPQMHSTPWRNLKTLYCVNNRNTHRSTQTLSFHLKEVLKQSIEKNINVFYMRWRRLPGKKNEGIFQGDRNILYFMGPIYRRTQWHPTPVLLPRKSQGRRSLEGCSPWGRAKSRIRLSDFTFTFHFHALEKERATHSSVLVWRIPGTGEPGGLPSMGSHRVRHD